MEMRVANRVNGVIATQCGFICHHYSGRSFDAWGKDRPFTEFMQLAKVLERGKSGEDWITGRLPAFGGF